ncbi:MAG: hypothetical protein WA908_10685 [Pontixanthobacter sp.]
MLNFSAFLTPLAFAVPLILPLASSEDDTHRGDVAAKLTPTPPIEHAKLPQEWLSLDDATTVPMQQQIRIERRVVIRVSPYRPSRANLAASPPKRRPARNLVERKVGKCIPMQSIGAVRTTGDNRLLLYMKDRRLIAAKLEKACSARDFYQGFYVEPSKDGKLCIKRDRLQSRTGVKCKMRQIRQLVPETT